MKMRGTRGSLFGGQSGLFGRLVALELAAGVIQNELNLVCLGSVTGTAVISEVWTQ